MRSCIICGTDISHRRSNAKVCTSYMCNRTRATKQGKTLYAKKKSDATYMERRRKHAQKPRSKYMMHKGTAFARGIGFNLTFDEWWGLWKPFWDDKKGNYCMCRTGDTGPYEIGNVRIDTFQNNSIEYHKSKLLK